MDLEEEIKNFERQGEDYLSKIAKHQKYIKLGESLQALVTDPNHQKHLKISLFTLREHLEQDVDTYSSIKKLQRAHQEVYDEIVDSGIPSYEFEVVEEPEDLKAKKLENLRTTSMLEKIEALMSADFQKLGFDEKTADAIARDPSVYHYLVIEDLKEKYDP